MVEMKLRYLIPAPLRLQYKIAHRTLRDIHSGHVFRFARLDNQTTPLEHCVEIIQEVKPGTLFENKCHNIRLAAAKISLVTVLPGQVFSFWKILGYPTLSNGFKNGRNLINGKISEAPGGGLCQVSGILHHLALKTGLEVIERHHHSVDIYQEHERFAPLGSDATVVYGYKDLRLRNAYPFAIRFELSLERANLHCRLLSEQSLDTHEVAFIRQRSDQMVHVQAMREGAIISRSTYRLGSLA